MEGPFASEWDDILSQGLDYNLCSQSAPPTESPEWEELGGVGQLPRIAVRSDRARPNRLRATGFFLTYSQTVIPRDDICRWFRNEQRLKRVIVGQEHHEDGNLHWHVLVEYEATKEVRTAYFDIAGEHPNIGVWIRARSGQTYEQWFFNHWKYCKKEDPTPYIIGEEPSLKESRKRKRDENFTEAFEIARNEGVAQAMTFLEETCPYDLGTKYDQIYRTMMAIRNSYLKVQEPARSVSEFKRAPPLVEWQTLYINGPTSCGKTAWARALLPQATLVRHRDQLRDCDFSKGVIFDDFDVGHWPPTAVIHLLDWDEPSGIDVKHAHVVIPAHTRKIFTHNCSFDRWVPKEAHEEQVQAMRRRVHVVNIHEKLFE